MNSSHHSGPIPPARISLASLTARSLRESLKAGHWPDRLPGERELCARLQVSRQTVRAALKELQRDGLLEVTERKRRRVRPGKAREPADHSQVIAAISSVPLLAMPPSLVVMVDELREKLAQAGFSLEIHVSPSCFTAKPARALAALTSRSPASVWLLLGSLAPMQSWFEHRRLPSLVVGSCAPGITLPSVDADFRAACRHACVMLRRKGHHSIALIRPEGDFGGDVESEQGMVEGLCGDPGAVLQVLRHDGTPKHLCAVLEGALNSPRPPTACVVARAVHALTVMMFLMQRGKRTPQDMAVVSRDEEMFLLHAVPAVTRYTAKPALLARSVCLAARRLAETGMPPPKPIRLMPQLVRGDTV